MKFLPLLALAALTGVAGCSTLPFDQPDVALPAAYRSGAELHLTSFDSTSEWGGFLTEDALERLSDQVNLGLIRCSRPGPRLDARVRAKFSPRTDGGRGSRLVGVISWRDPGAGGEIGRHQTEVVFEGDAWDLTARNQLDAGERLMGGLCEAAFGWSGLASADDQESGRVREQAAPDGPPAILETKPSSNP